MARSSSCMDTMFPDNAEYHPFTRLVLVLATSQSAALIAAAFQVVATIYALSDAIQTKRTRKRWDEVCRQVLRDRDELAHKVLGRASGEAADVDGILQKRQEAEDTRIARMRGTELMAAMLEGSLSSERAVAAFSRRSRAIGSEKHQAVTQEFYDEAVRAAAIIDAGRQGEGAGVRSGSGSGAGNNSGGRGGGRVLEGMPISVKDSIHMQGALTTCGMACKAALGPSEEDGLLVKVLRAHGAIPFVRGNVPQCLMLAESHNAIFGRSENPWKLGRTPGGSSGGEASLVSSRCAPLALGSDVGGSIRISCHFTGTCGLKPTPERMSAKGMATLSEDGRIGQRIIQVVSGPIANCVDDLNLAMTALCSPMMWDGDVSLPRLPWDSSVAEGGPGRPLKIGFFTTDHWFEPCAAVTRAVHEAAEGLRAKGHEVVPFEPPVSGWEIARLYYGQMGAEGNLKRFVDSLKGERMLPAYASLRRLASVPDFLRPFLSWLLRVVVKDYREASLLGVTRNKGLSVRQYYELVADTFGVRSRWEEAFAEAGLDAVVFPVSALPALPHGASKDLTPAFTYTFVANLLHWPAGVVPVTVVRPEEEDYDVESLPAMQRDETARFARAASKGSAGLPIGVQVMTTPFKEELTLHVMREVERAVDFVAVPKSAGL